ncbi:hypothetical protein CMUS01_11356 [Colletotrichum musicola]|uniref:Uncharacterized protein n=1 Tax=Colletotrichum musicola TaxID=2175873 RepID=A0A8H6JZ63_9PEZI|nr:hypothetical protein CMUS01_11356 [Colletotrichum musicola]
MPGTTTIAQWISGLRTRGSRRPEKRRAANTGAAYEYRQDAAAAASVDSDLDSTSSQASSSSSSSCSPASLSLSSSTASSLRDEPQVVAIQGVDEWALFLALEKEFGLRGFKINQRSDRYEIWAPRDIGEVSGIALYPLHRNT